MIRKILIVDDSPISRKILKSCIPADRGFEYVEAVNGLEGYERYCEHLPDVTFMDITMPVMDGIESLTRIMQQNPDALIIVCTADVQIKTLTKVMEIGAFQVVKKPPSKETVSEALRMAEESLRCSRAS